MNLRTVLFALLAWSAVPALAATGGVQLEPAYTNVGNAASLQRGAKLFMNYCSSCHSLQFLRYSRMAEDLGLSEEQVMANLNPAGAKFGETIRTSMTPDGAVAWFGAAPPDLSLTARSRGVDWIYNYLKSFYADDARAGGWNNTILPGASMPHVLWELQGVQRPLVEADAHGTGTAITRLELATPGDLSAAEYDEVVRDITTFMQYAAEPAALQREKYGVWVVLFLALLTFLLWMLKHEYWRDVH
ncbi:MAG TPA: cytochrome c1 [Xanthomonadales bacterium]|nr:cytochrome c1 [Xanthomonadales bacterium]